MDFSGFFYMVITMFLVLIVGFILGKIGIINASASKSFSTLLVMVAQPALIIGGKPALLAYGPLPFEGHGL